MDEYRFPGFRLKAVIKGIFGNSKARVIRIVRTQINGMRLLWRSISELLRQECAVGERFILRKDADFPASGDSACSVSRCGRVKREEVAWLSRNPFYTKRFAFFVGRKCRSMTLQDVAKELKLDWHTVKELDKVMGLGHTYRIE